MDFYQRVADNVSKLSTSEKNIFNYVVKNMHVVKNMSIRELSTQCFVSTTTMFRFVKKIGFDGYTDFVNAVSQTESDSRKLDLPSVVHNDDYADSYLKNIIEGVKVMTPEKIEQFDRIMSRYPKIYILGSGLSEEISLYFYHLLKVIGYDAEVLSKDYETRSALSHIKRNDVLFVLSYSGDNKKVIRRIEEIFAISTPTVISITRADNNIIQNMSDLNFYVFADEIMVAGENLTSHGGMIAVIETLLYKRMTKRSDGVI